MHWKDRLIENWQYRLLSLSLAFFCWYLVSGSEKVDTWLDIPLEFVDLPDNLVIRTGMRNRIQIRVRGASGIIRGLDSQHLAYKTDLSSLRVGLNTILLKQQNIPLNTSLEVMEISPPRLELDVDKIISRTVPVQVDWKGDLPADFELKEIVVRPQEISLKGASSVLEAMKAVRTKHVDIPSDVDRIWETKIALSIPEELETNVADVLTSFVFALKTKTLWVKLPVEVEQTQGFDVTVSPSFVRLKLDIPLPVLREKNWRARIVPRVVPESFSSPGTREIPYKISLPDDTVLLEAKPAKLEVTFTPKNSKESQ